MTMIGDVNACFKKFSVDMMGNTTLLNEIEKANFDLALIDGIPVVRHYYTVSIIRMTVHINEIFHSDPVCSQREITGVLFPDCLQV